MKNYTHFSKIERLEISILRKKGYAQNDIAASLCKSPSSVSREIKRNSVHGEYDPLKAHHKAYVKRKYSKYQGMKVREHGELEKYVREKMKLHWSPEQIAGRLAYATQERTLKADTIYKYLYSPYGYHLCRYLKYKQYRKKKRGTRKQKREIIKNRVFIDQRPKIINERQRFGDFEADTMGRPKYASSQTLVVARERLSRKLFGGKVSSLKYSMGELERILANDGACSLTLDNGVENVRYESLNIPTYFCHPYSSWEKGSVEQGIGLIREYIPKKADLKHYSRKTISAIFDTINNTPMKCLGFKTPNEVFNERVILNP